MLLPRTDTEDDGDDGHSVFLRVEGHGLVGVTLHGLEVVVADDDADRADGDVDEDGDVDARLDGKAAAELFQLVPAHSFLLDSSGRNVKTGFVYANF